MIPLTNYMSLIFISESYFPPEIHRVFGLDQQTALGVAFVLINISILAFILSRVLYKPVLNMLQNRTERIKSDLQNAKDEKTAAIDLKTQYEAKLKDIVAERDGILEAARKDAAEKSRLIVEEAKTEADTLRIRAQKNIEMEQERVKDEMRKSIIELAGAMAQKFVERTIDPALQDKLFAEVMAEIDGTDFQAGSV
jgi:F-type H+-transporting ATPase subunit b